MREESLADIAAIEMIDLPLSDSEGAIEKQLKSDNGMLTLLFEFLISLSKNFISNYLLNISHSFTNVNANHFR